MRVSDFDDFDRFETEGLLTGTKERSWLWFGLIVSLGIHLALCAYFYRTRFQTVEALTPPNEQTPTFKVRSINTSDLGKSSVDQTNPAAKPNPDNTDVQLPDEKKSFDKLLQDVQASAAIPDDMRDVLPDQPKVEQPEVNSVLTEIERSTARAKKSARVRHKITTAGRSTLRIRQRRASIKRYQSIAKAGHSHPA